MSDKTKYSYTYPHPAVTTDCVIFGFDGRQMNILLVERKFDPYRGSWALPGGFLQLDETLEECAKRELLEETHLQLPNDTYFEQFHVFSAVDRDPRERVITVAFYALVRPIDFNIKGGDDAKQANWFPQDELPPLAFDHESIINMAKERLKEKVRTQPIAFKLLNNKFSITELQTLYEKILGIRYDRRNFYRKVMSSGLLEEKSTRGDIESTTRRANLYSIKEETIDEVCSLPTPGKFPFDF